MFAVRIEVTTGVIGLYLASSASYDSCYDFYCDSLIYVLDNFAIMDPNAANSTKSFS